jgi:hypothetical protein
MRKQGGQKKTGMRKQGGRKKEGERKTEDGSSQE